MDRVRVMKRELSGSNGELHEMGIPFASTDGNSRLKNLMAEPRADVVAQIAVVIAAPSAFPCLLVMSTELEYASDITYIRTGLSWLYLAVVLDLFPHSVRGWAMRRACQPPWFVMPCMANYRLTPFPSPACSKK